MQTTATQRGFAAVCFRCGDADAVVRVNLADTSEFKCDGCDSEFSAGDVREHLASWQAVLAWISTAPVVEDR